MNSLWSATLSLVIGTISAAPAACQAPSNNQSESQSVTDTIIDNYISLCMRGEMRFPPTSIEKIKFAQLPIELRSWYLAWPTATYLRSKSPKSYIVVFENPRARDDDYQKICSVAALHIPIEYAFERVNLILGYRFAPGALAKNASEFGHNDPDFKYTISVTTLKGIQGSNFTVMQTSSLNDFTRAKLIKSRNLALAKPTIK